MKQHPIAAKMLRLINRRLRPLERQAGVNFVAFRLGLLPSEAKNLLDGEVRLKMNDLSDLALAVGCEPELKVRRTHHRRSRPQDSRP